MGRIAVMFQWMTPLVIIIVYYATEAAHIIHYTNIGLQHKTQKIKTSKTIHNTETKFRYQQSEQTQQTTGNADEFPRRPTFTELRFYVPLVDTK